MKTSLQLLVCEDNENDALFLIRTLEKAGFIVASTRVETACEMETALKKQGWDIIISDFNIPGFGAHEALRILKASGMDIPFVLVSGTVGEQTAVDIMKAGASDYLMKGNLARLGEVVKRELHEAINRRERKIADEQIKANEEKYRAVIDNCVFAIFLASPGGLIEEANEAACELYGYTQEEFRNMTLDKILYHADPVMMEKSTEAKEWDSNEEFKGMKKNGRQFHCEASSIIFRDIKGAEICCIMLFDISLRKDAEQALQHRNDELKRLSNHLKKAREDERKYISMEIHDQLGQLASAIKMDLDWLNKHMATTNDKAKEKIERAINTVRIMIDSTRQIATSLRPSIIDHSGLNNLLKWQCTEFQKLNGITCDFEASFDDEGASLEMRTELFRICQESLTNVMRHAQASHIRVSIKENKDAVSLCIEDDGKGFDTSQNSTHLGLVGIRERALSLDGDLEIQSAPGRGTSLCITIPKDKIIIYK